MQTTDKIGKPAQTVNANLVETMLMIYRLSLPCYTDCHYHDIHVQTVITMLNEHPLTQEIIAN